jgi:hypothetical protein
MNIEKLKDLKIRCICNEILSFHNGVKLFTYYCKNIHCYYNTDSFRTHCVVVHYNNSFEINLHRDSGVIAKGFVSSNFNGTVLDTDLVLSPESMVDIINLCDMNKYIEKYESLILFK